MPPDTNLPDPTPIRPPVFVSELTDVRCHISSGLVQLPSGHLFLGSDGHLRLGLLAGGPAQEMRDLAHGHRRLSGSWATAEATPYFYHHIVDNCVPLLKAGRAVPGIQTAVPPGQHSWYYDVLSTLGIDWVVVPERAVTIEHLVVVDRASLASGDVALLREHGLSAGGDAAAIDVLFVSRRGLPRFDEPAESQMLAILSPLAVTSIDPSAMAFAEQVRAFRSARMVVGAHGGALTNVVWSQHARLVVEVFARGFRGLEFSRIAQAAGIPYVPCTSEDLSGLSLAVQSMLPEQP